jgi:hypothetical protein
MGKLEGVLFTRDFERWMKGAVEVERLSLSLGDPVGGLIYCGPWTMCKGRLWRWASLFEEAE